MTAASRTHPPTACPACGSAIPPDAPQGLCPRCALAGAASDPAVPLRGESPPLPQVQAAFPHLEVLELLGAGGMGFVFKVRQPQLDRPAALKLLPIPLAADPAFSERFLREGRLLARLAHPGIVTVYDFGQAGGFAYLLMEFVDGVNLRQAMAAGRFTPDEALSVIPRICEALQYAHEQGVLHRDIKPENILLDAQGRVKIADFGIAKLAGTAQPGVTLTADGSRLGTPHYMAPEQVERPAEVDHRADIYSLGVVFYELLTGELPLGRFPPPSSKTPLDRRIDDIVLRSLEKERTRRQQSAGEMKTQVEHVASSAAPPPTPSAPAFTAPARAPRSFEYRSKATLFGRPLLHIANGVDPITGRGMEARGIIAIGNRAAGLAAFGGFARGGLAVGGISIGVISIGGIALGLVSYGGLALALAMAFGGLAVGWESFGGLAIGNHALGGVALPLKATPTEGWRQALLQALPLLWLPVMFLAMVPSLIETVVALVSRKRGESHLPPHQRTPATRIALNAVGLMIPVVSTLIVLGSIYFATPFQPEKVFVATIDGSGAGGSVDEVLRNSLDRQTELAWEIQLNDSNAWHRSEVMLGFRGNTQIAHLSRPNPRQPYRARAEIRLIRLDDPARTRVELTLAGEDRVTHGATLELDAPYGSVANSLLMSSYSGRFTGRGPLDLARLDTSPLTLSFTNRTSLPAAGPVRWQRVEAGQP